MLMSLQKYINIQNTVRFSKRIGINANAVEIYTVVL